MIILKFVCPFIVLSLLLVWNRIIRIKKVKRRQKESIPRYEFGNITGESVKKLKNFPCMLSKIRALETLHLQNSKQGTDRVCKIILGEKIIAVILYTWPSYLSTATHTYIHYVEVLDGYRNRGYLRCLINLVISETRGISSGLRICVEDPVQKRIFTKKLGFEDHETYLLRLW